MVDTILSCQGYVLLIIPHSSVSYILLRDLYPVAHSLPKNLQQHPPNYKRKTILFSLKVYALFHLRPNYLFFILMLQPNQTVHYFTNMPRKMILLSLLLLNLAYKDLSSTILERKN